MPVTQQRVGGILTTSDPVPRRATPAFDDSPTLSLHTLQSDMQRSTLSSKKASRERSNMKSIADNTPHPVYSSAPWHTCPLAYSHPAVIYAQMSRLALRLPLLSAAGILGALHISKCCTTP
ncbi:hypothetical protein WMY93_031321 [Mugilogobius chulae]|uniref:Uncharacterized protein n=1 Tax=Mugilogobius chulae TaxID=88201 RepID=A0AAW0MEX8_9GOBI